MVYALLIHMISVVIPTMWKHDGLCDFLTQVCAQPHVQEVIIINNDHSRTPAHVILEHEKVHMINLGVNLYVNPSWNLGVYHTQAPIICLQNDDISFDCDVYAKVSQFIKPHMGLISLGSLHIQHEPLEFRLWQGESQFGCGQLMFFNRHNFCHIDPELRVYCGDNWLFDHMWHKTKQNYMMYNLKHETPYAQTSKWFRHMLESEQKRYAQICEQHRILRLHV